MTSIIAMLVDRLHIGERTLVAEPDPKKGAWLEDSRLELLKRYAASAVAELDHVLPPEGDQ